MELTKRMIELGSGFQGDAERNHGRFFWPMRVAEHSFVAGIQSCWYFQDAVAGFVQKHVSASMKRDGASNDVAVTINQKNLSRKCSTLDTGALLCRKRYLYFV